MGRLNDGSKKIVVQSSLAESNDENNEKQQYITNNKHSILVHIDGGDGGDTIVNNFDNKKQNQNELTNIAAICRICHCSNEDLNETSSSKSNQPNLNNQDSVMKNPFILIQPCYCTGTLQYVHHNCLQKWIRSSNHRYCELCKYNFEIKTKNKPILQWQCMNMTNNERRKLILHIIFNLISLICIFWSIYVIAERATYELTNRFGWNFWIKMMVISIGLVCGIIFIIFQLRLYFSILSRWKQYNQIFIIENIRNNVTK